MVLGLVVSEGVLESEELEVLVEVELEGVGLVLEEVSARAGVLLEALE